MDFWGGGAWERSRSRRAGECARVSKRVAKPGRSFASPSEGSQILYKNRIKLRPLWRCILLHSIFFPSDFHHLCNKPHRQKGCDIILSSHRIAERVQISIWPSHSTQGFGFPHFGDRPHLVRDSSRGEGLNSHLTKENPNGGFRMWSFGSRLSDLGFRVLGTGFRVPGLGSRVSGFGFRVSGSGFQVTGFRSRVSGSGSH